MKRIFFIIIFIFSINLISAQGGECSKHIIGVVKNMVNQKPILDVSIECFDPDGGSTTVFTDSSGRFEIKNIICGLRYDIVAFNDNFNGFAEVQTVATKGNELTLYLDPSHPEEFEDEIDAISETTVIDTQTNKIIEASIPSDADIVSNQDNTPKNLSFAQKRKLARLKKEKEKKERIEAEVAVERKRREAIVRRKEEAQIVIENTKKEEEAQKQIEIEERKEAVAQANKIAREEQIAERKVIVAKAKAESNRVNEEIEAKHKEEIAQAKAEKKVIEEAENKQKQLVEKERQQVIAEAREKVRLHKEELARKEKIAKEKEEQEAQVRLAQIEEAKIEQQKKQLEVDNLARERAENVRKAREAIAEQKRKEELAVAEQKAQAIKDTAEREAVKVAAAKTAAAERQKMIVTAEEQATKIREEQAQAERIEQAKVESSRLAAIEAKKLKDAEDKATEIREVQEALAAKKRQEEIALAEQKLQEQKDAAEREAVKIAAAKTAAAERQKMIAAAEEQAAKIREEQANVERTEQEKEEASRLAAIEAKKLKDAEDKATEIREVQEALATKKRQEEIALAEQKLQEQKDAAEREAVKIAAAKTAEAERQKMIIAAEEQAAKIRKEQADAKQIEQVKAEEASRLAVIEAKKLKDDEDKILAEQKVKENKEVAEREASKIADAEIAEAKKLAQIQAKAKQKLAERKAAEVEAKRIAAEKEVDYTNPERCAISINGIVRSSVNGKVISHATVDVYFEGENIESVKSDKDGKFQFQNYDCNSKYTIITYKEEIDDLAKHTVHTKSLSEDVVLLLEADSEYFTYMEDENSKNEVKKEEESIAVDEESIDKTVYEKVEAPKIVEGKVDIDPIFFDLDEHYLTLPARRELDKIIVLMKLRPTMVIESGSHTDTQGEFDYNIELSEKRSQETVGYLVANGVNPDRVSGRGYGETMPLNHCFDGVKCTEAEHHANRRTEFRVLKQ